MEIKQETINSLNEIFSDSATTAIEAYSKWLVVNSISWIIFSVIIAYAALTINWPQPAAMSGYSAFPLFIKTITCLVSLMMLAVNIPNLIATKAYAIHYLIRDITG